MEAYAFKGEALEEVSSLFLKVPLPKSATQEDRDQFKQASDESKEKAINNYKEALLAAQNYYLDNEPRKKSVARLRELQADAPELNIQATSRPKSATPVSQGATDGQPKE
jgi:hypothetical protein